MRICDPPPPASSPASPPASPPAGLLPGRPCREAVALEGATARKHRPNATGWACKYRLWAVIAPPGFRLRPRFAGSPCAIGTPVAKPFLLGISLTVEQRTLTPSVLVRIQDPQPVKSATLTTFPHAQRSLAACGAKPRQRAGKVRTAFRHRRKFTLAHRLRRGEIAVGKNLFLERQTDILHWHSR